MERRQGEKDGRSRRSALSEEGPRSSQINTAPPKPFAGPGSCETGLPAASEYELI